VLIDLAKLEHHTPEYLKLNPNGVIPLLVLPDGRSLYESGTICEFLDESFPEPSLRPADPYGRAEMRNWIRYADERIGNLIIFNWKHSLAKTASQWSDEELAERLKKVPSKERQEAWRRAARRPYTAEEEGEARRRLVLMLDKMEESLGRHAWLVGDGYSLADIAVVPFIKRIDEEIAPDEVSAQKHPRVLAWWQRIQSRPAFAEARIGPFV
jgi:glutathione S-transferase